MDRGIGFQVHSPNGCAQISNPTRQRGPSVARSAAQNLPHQLSERASNGAELSEGIASCPPSLTRRVAGSATELGNPGGSSHGIPPSTDLLPTIGECTPGFQPVIGLNT